MTAGTVVITGGILATVILLCIIAVLCYCRLQVLGGLREPGEGSPGWALQGRSGGAPQRAGAQLQEESGPEEGANRQPRPPDSTCDDSFPDTLGGEAAEAQRG